MNRTARLDHDPLAGKPPVPLSSNVSQPPSYYPPEPKRKAKKDRQTNALIPAKHPMHRVGAPR